MRFWCYNNLWLKFNQLFAKGQWDEALEKAGIKADVSGFLGQVVRWILVLTFLSAAVEILGLVQFANLFSEIIAWLPNLLVIVAIMVATVVVAEILEKISLASLTRAKIKYAKALAMVVRWSVYIFALLAILLQIDIGASVLVNTLFTGLVAMMVIAGGLAFGLGGKDVAREILEEVAKKLRE